MTDLCTRHSVLLIDMGGPQSMDEVKPYLQKIFSDPYIIPGNPVKRWLLSRLIAGKSAAETRNRYAEIGGRSTAVDNAKILGEQLIRYFADRGIHVECEVATRYSSPDIPQGLDSLSHRQKAPITAVYLFPQETSALTGSCEAVLARAATRRGLSIRHDVRHLRRAAAYIQGWADGIKDAVQNPDRTYVMMTAHSLPMSIIERGDCYIREVDHSAEQIKALLGNVTSGLAYQSQESGDWLGPTVEEKATEAFENGFREIIIAPLSFVGDNTETLLDIDKDLYQAVKPLGFERFERIAPPDQRGFLCEMVAESLSQEWGCESEA